MADHGSGNKDLKNMKEFYHKHREVILYLLFGVLTTVVSFAAYFAVFWTWKAVAGIPADDTTSPQYILAYTVAQIAQWVTGVLFAFFTNRKWVFEDAEKNGTLWSQLLKFSGARVVTFFVDYGVTYFGAIALTSLVPSLIAVSLLGMTLNFCDLIAKFVAAVIVVVSNYVISKLFVFKKSRK